MEKQEKQLTLIEWNLKEEETAAIRTLREMDCPQDSNGVCPKGCPLYMRNDDCVKKAALRQGLYGGDLDETYTEEIPPNETDTQTPESEETHNGSTENETEEPDTEEGSTEP